MKQETLEEAADNYAKEPFQVAAFYQGAKWQQERMYSEEEVIKAIGDARVFYKTDEDDGYDEFKHTPIEIIHSLKQFKKYHNNKSKNENENISFYNWLLNNTSYIEDYDTLIKIYNLFDLTKNYCNIKVFEDIRIANGPIIKNSMNEILKTIGFIFKYVGEV